MDVEAILSYKILESLLLATCKKLQSPQVMHLLKCPSFAIIMQQPDTLKLGGATIHGQGCIAICRSQTTYTTTLYVDNTMSRHTSYSSKSIFALRQQCNNKAIIWALPEKHKDLLHLLRILNSNLIGSRKEGTFLT